MDDIAEKVRTLRQRIEELKASRPAHDSTGFHDMELLSLEDELTDKMKAIPDRINERGRPAR